MTTLQRHRAVASAAFALALLAVQFGTFMFSGSETAVRIVLPATMLAVPLALWAYRDRIGVWVIFVGLAANLAVVLANGGLMPMREATLVDALGEARAQDYSAGDWIEGSKDILVDAGGGRFVVLGDGIVLRIGNGGMVVSPGDIVVWCGLLILAAEASISWQTRTRREHSPAGHAAAEGGATT